MSNIAVANIFPCVSSNNHENFLLCGAIELIITNGSTFNVSYSFGGQYSIKVAPNTEKIHRWSIPVDTELILTLPTRKIFSELNIFVTIVKLKK